MGLVEKLRSRRLERGHKGISGSVGTSTIPALTSLWAGVSKEAGLRVPRNHMCTCVQTHTPD